MTEAAEHEEYDVVIAGAGVNGALIAKHLTRAGFRVLVLEAGPGSAWSLDGYSRHLEHFYAAASKGPESPWPPAVAAPQPDTGDIRSGAGYFVQNGPDKYGSSYTRAQGGSTLHWLGVCLRMLPEDFELRSRFGVGHDWPLRYADLEPYYGRAEHEIGVAADVADQAHHGIEFPDGYDYPMRRIPLSFSDQVLAACHKDLTFADIQQSNELARQAHIEACHFLIVGGPGETGATLEESFQNSKHLNGAVVMAVVGMRIYPGTHLFEQAVTEGAIERNVDLLNPLYYLAPGLTPESLFERLLGFARLAPNWIAGDPAPAYTSLVQRMRRRGVAGPLWSYFSMMQRLWPQGLPGTAAP